MSTTASVASDRETAHPPTPEWRETKREPFVRLRDNPIARAFARRALRPTRVGPGTVIDGRFWKCGARNNSG